MRQDRGTARNPKSGSTRRPAKAKPATPARASKTPRTAKPVSREALNLRIKVEDRALIDKAASLSGRTRTDFLLDAGRHAAMDALLDRAFFQTDPAAFATFAARLDAAPNPNERLKRMLRTPAPWDR